MAELRSLKISAGDPSLRDLQRATGYARSTLADAFNPRRPTLPPLALVTALVRAFGGSAQDVAIWENAWKTVRAGADSGGAPRPVPAQLGRDLADFTGRREYVTHLCDLLAPTSETHPDGPATVAVITGSGGVGKTALGLHAAHRLSGQFPDGQLYANLRGMSPTPAKVEDLLAGFLRALAGEGVAVPVEVDDRAAAYRSLLAGRQILVLLDDALDSAQVRSLLPAAAGCGVVVTSRSRLPGLDSVCRVDLDVLDDEEARMLFARIVGPARAGADPHATDAVLTFCGGLPLAIRIAAGRLACERGWTTRTLADLLADQQHRLDELNVEDRSVRAAFQLSYSRLPSLVACTFRALALLAGPYICVSEVSALLNIADRDARRHLAALVDIHFLQDAGDGRFRLNELFRVFAADRARAEDRPDAYMTHPDRGAGFGNSNGRRSKVSELRCQAVMTPGT
jgi:NB-ARC domain